MLQDVDQSIKNLLLAELRLSPDGLIKDEAQIEFGPGPKDSPPAKPTLCLFLHDVHENLETRDQSFEVRRGPDLREVAKSRKATRLNLSYLVTAHAKDTEAEHRLLGEALGVLMRNGFIPPKHLAGSLAIFGEPAVTISVAQRDHWAHSDAPRVWQATGLPLRPFIGIVAGALFDPFETRTVKLVREAILALGQGADPDGADRQMVVHSTRVSAAGTVSDVNGDAIPDVKVAIKGRSEATITDAQGVFLFRNLPSGPHTLVFSKAGLESREEEVISPVKGLANELQPVAVQMTSASDARRAQEAESEFVGLPRSNTLVGTLRYADGTPASFVPVKVGERTVVTDAEGVYRFTELPHRAREIVAEIAGRGEITLPVKPGSPTSEVPKK